MKRYRIQTSTQHGWITEERPQEPPVDVEDSPAKLIAVGCLYLAVSIAMIGAIILGIVRVIV